MNNRGDDVENIGLNMFAGIFSAMMSEEEERNNVQKAASNDELLAIAEKINTNEGFLAVIQSTYVNEEVLICLLRYAETANPVQSILDLIEHPAAGCLAYIAFAKFIAKIVSTRDVGEQIRATRAKYEKLKSDEIRDGSMDDGISPEKLEKIIASFEEEHMNLLKFVVQKLLQYSEGHKEVVEILSISCPTLL